MFTTQLTGYLQRIVEKEEWNIEEAARVLAQAVINDGFIHIKGFGEMACVEQEALAGAEPLAKARSLQIEALETTDCVLLVSRYADDEEAVALAKQLRERDIPTVSVAACQKEATVSLADYTDVHVDTLLTRKLLPADDGARYGYPSGMIALFIYHSIVFTMGEMLEDYVE